jgi:hypothetical protein
MLQSKRITYIYWTIKCTPKAKFISMFNVEGIARIYWPIDYTPNIGFV